MPLLTSKIHEMNRIRELQVSPDEKIKLLEAIHLTSEEFGCSHCRGRRQAAEKLLGDMVKYEIELVRNGSRDPM